MIGLALYFGTYVIESLTLGCAHTAAQLVLLPDLLSQFSESKLDEKLDINFR